MYQNFLEFLRFSLDGKASVPASVRDMDWKGLYRFGSEQALLGVLFLGICRLPKEMAPPRDILLKWINVSGQIRRRNEEVSKVADKVSGYFLKHGFRTFVLKGQGNALMYPNPWMRTPGDVDIFVEGGDKKVLKFAREKLKGGKAVYHHIEVPDVDGVPVEVHYRPSFLQNPVYNARLQHWFKECLEEQYANIKVIEANCETYHFAAPTWEFNIVYQLAHMSNHFMKEGVGLRQITDYYQLIIDKNGEEFNVSSLIFNLKHLGLDKFAGAVMWVLREIFHLPEERMIVSVNERLGRLLLDEILQGGNFGQHDKRISRWERESALGRNIQRLRRDFHFCCYYPSEALCEPLFRVWHYFWRKMKIKLC